MLLFTLHNVMNKNATKRIQCTHDVCEKTFETQSGRSKHHKVCKKAARSKGYKKLPDGTFSCDTCSKVIKGLTNVYGHVQKFMTKNSYFWRKTPSSLLGTIKIKTISKCEFGGYTG